MKNRSNLILLFLFLFQTLMSQPLFRAENPAIPGFSPDPAFCRVGNDYYVANSTFTWCPGITLYHSKDMANWDLVGQALITKRQLDLKHYESDWGVWAPDLTYDGNRFCLVYTVFNLDNGTIYERNYIVFSKIIEGPWSTPVLLNQIGIDPSIFHDTNGKKYILTNGHMYLPEDKAYFDKNRGYSAYIKRGALRQIFIQELNTECTATIDQPIEISRGTGIQYSEGPRIYKHNNWYYLILAEGTTFWNHAVTISRSRSVFGPYEPYGKNPVLCAKDAPNYPLQKSGHAALVEMPDGRCFISFLASRPLNAPDSKDDMNTKKSNSLLFEDSNDDVRRSVLGRETCFQEMKWTVDDWLVPLSESSLPSISYNALAPRTKDWSLHFDFSILSKVPVDFQSFCVPYDSTWVSFNDGALRLIGQEPITSLGNQSLLAVRLRSFHTETTSSFIFNAKNSYQSAGITFFYNNKCFYYMCSTFREGIGQVVELMCANKGLLKVIAQQKIDNTGLIEMKFNIDNAFCSFSYRFKGETTWKAMADRLDATIISDENGVGFTGAMVGIAVEDISGRKACADFHSFNMIVK